MRSTKRQSSGDAAAMTSRVKRSRSRGLERLCIKTFQRQRHGRCKGVEVSWEALVAGLWRWAFVFIVVVMAIPLSGFVKWLSIVFYGSGIATAGQGSIVPF